MSFFIFTELCIHHHSQFVNINSHPSSSLAHLHLHQPQATTGVLSFSMDLPILGILYKIDSYNVYAF